MARITAHRRRFAAVTIATTAVATLAAQLGFAGASLAQTGAQSAAKAEAQAVIWAKEQSIYQGRSQGGMAAYVSNTAANYLAWPPTTSAPIPVGALKTAETSLHAGKERSSRSLAGFTLQGDTAVIYYVNHRTALGDGTPVDQYFDNIHVWVRDGKDWKVLAGMSRLEDKKP